MKRAAVALSNFAGRFARSVGLEGTFLTAGTGLMAVGAQSLHPAGAWFVVGAACVLVALALAVPQRS